MTTPNEIQRRRAETFAALESARTHWDRQQRDHLERLWQLQAECPHRNLRSTASQCGVDIACSDCGKELVESK